MTMRIFISLIILSSCSTVLDEKEWNIVKSSSSIDKYQEYLIENPHTEHFTEIVDSLRLFWNRKNIKSLGHHCFPNCLSVMINDSGQIFFEDILIDKSTLKEKVRYSILNSDDLDDLPIKRIVSIENIGNVLVSMGTINISTTKTLDTKIYSEILDTIKFGFYEIRENVSQMIYNQKYRQLEENEQANIKLLVPLNINFERFKFSSPGLYFPPLPLDSVRSDSNFF